MGTGSGTGTEAGPGVPHERWRETSLKRFTGDLAAIFGGGRPMERGEPGSAQLEIFGIWTRMDMKQSTPGSALSLYGTLN